MHSYVLYGMCEMKNNDEQRLGLMANIGPITRTIFF